MTTTLKNEQVISNDPATENDAVVFGAGCDEATWQPRSEHEIAIERIDEALELIAEANSVAAGKIPVTRFDVTVIVPVFNEIRTIERVIKRIEKVMPPATEVIIVDDGSTDGTAEWLQSLPHSASRQVICRRANHGKGSAVRLAIRRSQGRVVAIQDADMEYDPADLLRVIWPILDGDADATYGSRYLNGWDDSSMVHRLGNWLLTSVSNCLTGLQLTDMETCHKAFDGDLIRSMELRECRFGFEPEITAKIAAGHYELIEVPTGYQARSYKEGKKIGWRDAVSALACMWRYRKG
ncbi:MAG: glycosyltransferase family 2 protein [Rubripirellula sp.]